MRWVEAHSEKQAEHVQGQTLGSRNEFKTFNGSNLLSGVVRALPMENPHR